MHQLFWVEANPGFREPQSPRKVLLRFPLLVYPRLSQGRLCKSAFLIQDELGKKEDDRIGKQD